MQPGHRRQAERAPHPNNIAIETSTISQRAENALARPLGHINPKITPSSNSPLRTPPLLIPDSVQPFARPPHCRAAILLVPPQALHPHILYTAAITQLLDVLDLPDLVRFEPFEKACPQFPRVFQRFWPRVSFLWMARASLPVMQ